MWRYIIAVFLMSTSAFAICESDSDCKGTRICEDGVCKNPSNTAIPKDDHSPPMNNGFQFGLSAGWSMVDDIKQRSSCSDLSFQGLCSKNGSSFTSSFTTRTGNLNPAFEVRAGWKAGWFEFGVTSNLANTKNTPDTSTENKDWGVLLDISPTIQFFPAATKTNTQASLSISLGVRSLIPGGDLSAALDKRVTTCEKVLSETSVPCFVDTGFFTGPVFGLSGGIRVRGVRVDLKYSYSEIEVGKIIIGNSPDVVTFKDSIIWNRIQFIIGYDFFTTNVK